MMYLAESEFSLVPFGLNNRRVQTVRQFGFGEQLWDTKSSSHALKNRGLPARPRRSWIEMQKLFLKYGRFRIEFEEAAAEIWRSYFSTSTLNQETSFVIGVHWRGTDRRNGLTRAFSADDFFARLHEIAAHHSASAAGSATVSTQDVVLVVAADEAAFVTRCQEEFPRVLSQSGIVRASSGGQALHMDKSRDPEANARAVIIDALLLSKCNHLVKGRSCVSDYALFLQPEMACDMFDNETGLIWRKRAGITNYFEQT
jgi:hypothetical protein